MEDRADAQFAFDVYRAAAGFDERVGDAQAEAGALGAFGRVERIENARLVLGRNACAALFESDTLPVLYVASC